MSNLIEPNKYENGCSSIEWHPAPDGTYACRAMVCEDEDGGYFAYATRLPGVVGEGSTFEDAVDSVREGFEAVLSDYLTQGEIPWREEVIREHGTLVCLSISVHG